MKPRTACCGHTSVPRVCVQPYTARQHQSRNTWQMTEPNRVGSNLPARGRKRLSSPLQPLAGTIVTPVSSSSAHGAESGAPNSSSAAWQAAAGSTADTKPFYCRRADDVTLFSARGQPASTHVSTDDHCGCTPGVLNSRRHEYRAVRSIFMVELLSAVRELGRASKAPSKAIIGVTTPRRRPSMHPAPQNEMPRRRPSAHHHDKKVPPDLR